jgi:hypothetical protein
MFIVILLTISAVTHWQWTLTNSILAHGDWYYQSQNTLRELLNFPTIWSTVSFGVVGITNSFYPFQLVYGILATIGLDYALSQRLIFLWPIVVFCPLGSYLLLRRIINNNLAAFVGSFIYTFNTYFLVIQTGHLTLMAAYSFAPLVLLFFRAGLEKKSVAYMILASLISFIVSFYEFRALYILVWVLFFYYLYYQIIIEKEFTLKNIIKNGIYSGIPIMIVLLLNSYWLIGFSQLGALTSNEIFNRMLFGNELIDIRNAFTLFHPFWTGKHLTEFVPQLIPFYFWIVAFFAFIGLFFQRKNKEVVFYGSIALLGILLTKQVSEPFSNLYLWLYNTLPGFNAYREASKFFFLIALGYSVLISAFIDLLWKKWNNNNFKIFGKYLITISISFIFLWNTKPLFTGEIGTLFIPRAIHSDYKIIEQHLISDNTFYRTYWVPMYSRWSFYSNIHPQVSAILELNSTYKKLTDDNIAHSKLSEGEKIVRLLQNNEINNIFDISSIKYVFVPIQDSANDDDFFKYYGVTREEYITVLDNLEFLERINIDTKEIIVYENEGYKPHIYLTRENESVNKSISYENVNFQFVNPSKYNVHLRNISDPLFLNFSESFHPQWEVRVGNFSWWESLLESNYFLPDNVQQNNRTGFSSYRIDPNSVCLQYECIKNSDGSYDIDITVYFSPQSYVYVGTIITIMTFGIILGYFGFKLYEKKK